MGQVGQRVFDSGDGVSLRFRPNRRAKRYLLRISRDGVPTVTVPRFGNRREALAFVEQHKGWIARQLDAYAARRAVDRSWRIGSLVMLGGELLPICAEGGESRTRLRVGERHVGFYDGSDRDLRPLIEGNLWAAGRVDLPARLAELSAQHGFVVTRVLVRNQRSRWGSCSRRGTISLNWRLVQAPPCVRDYIILHELAHLRHLNHSARFWKEVARICPGYESAEAWLKANSGLLR